MTTEEIHGLTGVSRKAIREIREAMATHTPHFRNCRPWLCHSCGGLNVVTPCVRCSQAAIDNYRQRLIAAGVERTVRADMLREHNESHFLRQRKAPRHPSFTSA